MNHYKTIFERVGWHFILFCALAICSFANTATGTIVRPGVWCSQHASHVLSPVQRELLQTKLRRITGWTQVTFAENGSLELGDLTAIEGGASSARHVLMRALRCGKQFVLENHSTSAAVNFGQLDEGTNYSDDRSGLRLEIYRVRLDFADFGKMQAAPIVRESFDEGFTFLHELLHGLGLRDTRVPEAIGECETVINQMRAELGLPLRDQYMAELLHLTSIIKTARLRFREQTLDRQGVARWRTHHLFFTVDFTPLQPSAASTSSAEATTTCLSLY